MFETLMNVLLFLIIGVCVYWDLKYRRIPNFFTLPTILIGLVLHLIFWGLPGLKSSLIGFLLGLAVLIIPFALGGMGGGDVKFLAAIGAIKGTPFILNAAICSAFAGGVMAICLLLYKGQLFALLKKWVFVMVDMFLPGIVQMQHIDAEGIGNQALPYGVAIGIGTIVALIVG
jgi:prepilin peptidase CpaA